MSNKSGVALVLEDEPLISLDIEFMLQDVGLDVTVLRTCEEAHAWLEVCRPDVVIVDIVLADGPCHDFVSKLVETNIPFIVHSALQHRAYPGRGFRLS